MHDLTTMSKATTRCPSGNFYEGKILSLLPELTKVQRSMNIPPGAKLSLFAICLHKYLIKSLRGG